MFFLLLLHIIFIVILTLLLLNFNLISSKDLSVFILHYNKNRYSNIIKYS